MTLRARRSVAAVSAALVLLGVLLVTIAFPATAGAAPGKPGAPGHPSTAARATPAAATKTPPPPGLRLTVPGLVDVQVTLPDLGRVLGGRPTTAPPAPEKVVSAPASLPASRPTIRSSTAPRPQTAPARPAPARTVERVRTAQLDSADRAAGAANPRRQQPTRQQVRTAAPKPERTAPTRPEAVQFQRMLREKAPFWLFAAVIGTLVAGTVVVVCSAGHRSQGQHRSR